MWLWCLTILPPTGSCTDLSHFSSPHSINVWQWLGTDLDCSQNRIMYDISIWFFYLLVLPNLNITAISCYSCNSLGVTANIVDCIYPSNFTKNANAKHACPPAAIACYVSFMQMTYRYHTVTRRKWPDGTARSTWWRGSARSMDVEIVDASRMDSGLSLNSAGCAVKATFVMYRYGGITVG